MGGRMAAMSPHLKPIQDKAREALWAGDKMKSQQLNQEIFDLYKRGGVDIKKMIRPFLFQLPVGIGAFRLFKEMANVNVPGLEHGGLLWFMDLTIQDPLLVLPALTGGMLYATLRVKIPAA